MDDEYSIPAEVAASLLGIRASSLRQKLRNERPEGARQIPPVHGASWFLRKSYVESLSNRIRINQAAPLSTEIDKAEAPSSRPSTPRQPTEEEPHRTWSPWIPFDEALAVAPKYPGVYMLRTSHKPRHEPIYIGMAGERKGNGLRGRLAIYASGKGASSGLGEHALDRALADPDWMRARLAEAEAGTAMRATEAARSAIDHAQLEVRWQTVPTRAEALALEAELIGQYRGGLWNRRMNG